MGGEPYKGANTIRARTKVVNSLRLQLAAGVVQAKGIFVVHLAGLKGIAKCLAFRYYYGIARRDDGEVRGADGRGERGAADADHVPVREDMMRAVP